MKPINLTNFSESSSQDHNHGLELVRNVVGEISEMYDSPNLSDKAYLIQIIALAYEKIIEQ